MAELSLVPGFNFSFPVRYVSDFVGPGFDDPNPGHDGIQSQIDCMAYLGDGGFYEFDFSPEFDFFFF